MLRGLRPVLDATGPFLAQLNPVLQWLTYQQGTVSNFIAMPGWALQGKAGTSVPGSNGHVLPQLITAGSQTLITPTRSPDNRGNTYFGPDSLNLDTYRNGFFILPNWDCVDRRRRAQADGRRPGLRRRRRRRSSRVRRGRFPHILQSDFKAATR